MLPSSSFSLRRSSCIFSHKPQRVAVPTRWPKNVHVSHIIYNHHRIASMGRRVARPWWPRPSPCLQRSAGVWMVSFRIWSIHLPRGRPGRRLQEGWGRRPSERLTWDCIALYAGVLSCSLAMWPTTAMRRCRMTSLMAGRPVSADISELWTNFLHYIPNH